jgi:hypothetical protein
MSTTVSGAVTHILGNAAVVVKSPYGRAEHLISEEQGIKNLNTCTPNPIPDPLPVADLSNADSISRLNLSGPISGPI